MKTMACHLFGRGQLSGSFVWLVWNNHRGNLNHKTTVYMNENSFQDIAYTTKCIVWFRLPIMIAIFPQYELSLIHPFNDWLTVYPKKYAHGFCFAVLCCGYTLTDFPYPSGLLHWHCGNLTIAPVPAKQPWWKCEFIMNDYITTTKQSTTKPCAYFLGYTVMNV